MASGVQVPGMDGPCWQVHFSGLDTPTPTVTSAKLGGPVESLWSRMGTAFQSPGFFFTDKLESIHRKNLSGGFAKSYRTSRISQHTANPNAGTYGTVYRGGQNFLPLVAEEHPLSRSKTEIHFTWKLTALCDAEGAEHCKQV